MNNVTRTNKLFELECSGDYLNAAIEFLKIYKKKPILTFYFDGFFRNYKKIIKNNIEINNILKELIINTFGFIPNVSKSKKKLAFIGHSFHSKTLSSMFFIEILFEFFNVDILWSIDWKGCNDKYFNSLESYDIVVFWQTFPHRLNNKINNKIFIIPMLDGVIGFSDDDWKEYSSYKFISFTRVLHEKLITLGIKSLNVQAAPKLPKIESVKSQKNKKPVLFFWQRVDSITWNNIKMKIASKNVSKVFLMLDVDPNNQQCLPSIEDIKNYNIEFISWFENKESLKSLLIKCDIYIAPRPIEGIGFSFLDAMALGCIIVANNFPSMNEYIDETIGYLVDFKTDEKLNFYDFQSKREKSILKINKYIDMWNVDKNRIIEYILNGKGL